jgi:hypothetical protein
MAIGLSHGDRCNGIAGLIRLFITAAQRDIAVGDIAEAHVSTPINSWASNNDRMKRSFCAIPTLPSTVNIHGLYDSFCDRALQTAMPKQTPMRTTKHREMLG